jgi:superfamily II DNA/RNA helicase
LVQRIGRGARRRNVEATAIYLVESKYFDHAKNVQKRKPAENKLISGGKRRKVSDNVTAVVDGDQSSRRQEEDAADSEGSSRSQVEEAMGTSINGPSRSSTISASASLQKVLPSWRGMDDEEYEEAVMDCLINAEQRGICIRQVLDEYFGQDTMSEIQSCGLVMAVPFLTDNE